MLKNVCFFRIISNCDQNSSSFRHIPLSYMKSCKMCIICNPPELQNGRKLQFFLKKHVFSQKKVCFLSKISNCEQKSNWYRRNPLSYMKLCKIYIICTPQSFKKTKKRPKMSVFSKKTCILILRGTPRDQILSNWK